MEKVIRFHSYDGEELVGTLLRVAPPTRRPGVAVLVHGITSDRDELGLFSGLADHLSREGVPSFRFDYRCHGESAQGRPMEEMTLAGVVNDIEAAATRAMAETGSREAHVVGMSFGGGLSAFWASMTQKAVGSVVLLAPVIDYEEDVLGQYGLLSKGRLRNDAIKSLRANGYLETGGVRYGASLINELPFVNGVHGLRHLKEGCLIIHGDADSAVPFSSSVRHITLNRGGRLENIAGTDHGFGVPGDEDLTSPATKAKQREVFLLISRLIAQRVDHK